MKIFQRLVSKNKKRYVEDGVDLDLSYILENVIAMGFPAESIEAAYRNPLDEVVTFLNSKHRDRFMIYNLCQERIYDEKKFGDNVVHSFPFIDHNPPPFAMIYRFCESVDQWLKKNSENIAVIHCKAGKGRTGTMICCYMLHARLFSDYESCLQFYAEKRTNNLKGVTIPSQIRYVRYYHQYLHRKRKKTDTAIDPHVSIIIEQIIINHRATNTKRPMFSFCISTQSTVIYRSRERGEYDDNDCLVFPFTRPCHICGDFKITLLFPGVLGKKKSCQVWMNTMFMKDDSVESCPYGLSNLMNIAQSIEPNNNNYNTERFRNPLFDHASSKSERFTIKNPQFREDFRSLSPTDISLSCPLLKTVEASSSIQTTYKISYMRDQIDRLHKKYKKEFPEDFSVQIYYRIQESQGCSHRKSSMCISTDDLCENIKSFDDYMPSKMNSVLSSNTQDVSASESETSHSLSTKWVPMSYNDKEESLL